MKKLIFTLIILFIWTGLFSQPKRLIFKNVIISQLVNGQPSGHKQEKAKRVACTINQGMIRIDNLEGKGSALEFQIKKRETNITGADIYTCTLDDVEYSINLSSILK